MAAADGITTIVATPHMKEGAYVNERDAIGRSVETLQQQISSEGIPLTLRIGCEVYLAPDLPEGVRAGRLATLGDTGTHMLLELPHRQQPVAVEETVFALVVAGIVPVLAHPERILWFQEDPERLVRLIELGCLAQLTANSLTGAFREDVRALSESMIRRRMIHFIASDAHDLRYRPPVMSAARARVEAIAGELHADALCRGNAARLLAGEPIEAPPPEPAGRSGAGLGGFWRRFTGQ